MSKRYVALSLFSGCGGFCEGVRLAGFETVGAVEWDRFAAETYRFNFPEIPLFEGDVADFLNATSDAWTKERHRFPKVAPGTVDLVFGGPPCQGYSQIGPRSVNDPRNSLYSEFIRILKILQPKCFLMENVPNMLLLRGGLYRSRVLDDFRAAGYSNCTVRVEAASDYGVPQLRRRAIFFGVRDGSQLDATADDWMNASLGLEKRATTTVRDAIFDLPERVSTDGSPLPYPSSRSRSWVLNELRLDRDGTFYSSAAKRRAPRHLLYNHHTKEIQARRRALIAHLEPGLKGDSLPTDVWNGLRPEKWRRLHPDKPAYTILAQMHRDLSEWVHPKYERWITVREAARLQSFHDGFTFKSSEWQMLKQIGNAVPPLFGRALAVVAGSALQYLDGLADPTTRLATLQASFPFAGRPST